jgi:Lrp/AsnC family transcriptional regulator of ectoine degradation
VTPLDARDLAILQILSQEGRITKAALAERVGLSPTPCWERLKRLEDAGLIQGYGAQVNLKAIAAHVTVFVAAELQSHTADSFQRFERHLQGLPQVVACWALGGGYDYLMQIVERDIDAYQQLMDHLLNADIGLSRYFTYIVTKPIKAAGALPLAHLLGRAG